MKPKTITLYDFVEGQAVKISRVIAATLSDRQGPNIVFIGGMHGNEPTGVLALNRVMKKVQRLQPLLRGNVFALAGNLTALERGERYIQTDLNRIWRPEQVERARKRDFHPDELINEVEEQIELWGTIDSLMNAYKGEFIFVDLHTTSTRSVPFITMGDTIMNRHFARKIPVPVVIGIEEYITEPLLSYVNELGCISIAFEGGQHSDADSVRNHEAFITMCLARAGILKKMELPDYSDCRRRLKYQAGGNKFLYDVVLKQSLQPGDVFQMLPGFDNFSAVVKDQALARLNGHTLSSPRKGFIFMPLYQAKGEDAYFIVRRIKRFWLAVSYLFRRLGAYRILPFLPGVRRYMQSDYTLVVNAKIASIFSTDVLHLMGYRRKGQRGNFTLFVRRKYDFKGPPSR